MAANGAVVDRATPEHTVVPSLVKVTVPVGAGPAMSGAAGCTMAWYMTVWPGKEAGVSTMTRVLLLAWPTVTLTCPEEPNVLASPE